ncbi:hypothetical protein Q4E93_19875 [Flavitalea sp. BT771]|uniref:hypothetical protein n=1 Tax=Flavitalea sp. BT771 TaxID=3063329 RepID=UPI0026E179E7|nr:hypothetical protein [Flavitalea sp. BT771]MDO6432877.1 hypothetical protein [Flavitalea sp. BT771]MDV6221847.1 hypothetical protein [Flavitalea sp. BT771]
MKNLIYAALLVAGIIVLIGFPACRHEIPLPGSGGNTGGTDTVPGSGGGSGESCSADTVYFAQSVLPLLSSSCAQSGCHNGLTGGDAGEYTLNTYAGIRNIVRPGNAGGSKLIEVISSSTMPPRGYAGLTADQVALLSKWINQGARNNGCTAAACDTSAVTWSVTITSILHTWCTGCHSGSAPSGGGVDLTAYGNVLAQVNSGKLWGDISHLSGYNAMPLGGQPLPACELSKIRVWIKAGAPNN